MKGGALKGLKVLEFGEFISAPYCGKLLADLGDEVIKLEKPGQRDCARSWGPFPGNTLHPEKSGLFLFLNTNKLEITLNVNTMAGRDIFIGWSNGRMSLSRATRRRKWSIEHEYT